MNPFLIYTRDFGLAINRHRGSRSLWLETFMECFENQNFETDKFFDKESRDRNISQYTNSPQVPVPFVGFPNEDMSSFPNNTFEGSRTWTLYNPELQFGVFVYWVPIDNLNLTKVPDSWALKVLDQEAQYFYCGKFEIFAAQEGFRSFVQKMPTFSSPIKEEDDFPNLMKMYSQDAFYNQNIQLIKGYHYVAHALPQDLKVYENYGYWVANKYRKEDFPMYDGQIDEKLSKTKNIKDHSHIGLKRVGHVKHFHRCILCGYIYQHRHRIRSWIHSLDSGVHQCKECMQRKKTPEERRFMMRYHYADHVACGRVNDELKDMAYKKAQMWLHDSQTADFELLFRLRHLPGCVFCLLQHIRSMSATVPCPQWQEQGLSSYLFGNDIQQGIETVESRAREIQKESVASLSDMAGRIINSLKGTVTWVSVVGGIGTAIIICVRIAEYLQNRRRAHAEELIGSNLTKLVEILGPKFKEFKEQVGEENNGEEEPQTSTQATDEDGSTYFSNLLNQVANVMDAICNVPFKVVDFLKSHTKFALAFCVGLTQFKNGYNSLEWILQQGTKLVEKFLSWVAGESLVLKEKVKIQKEFDSQAITAICVIRYFLSADSNLRSSENQKLCFMTAYKLLEKYCIRYKKDKECQGIVQTAEALLKSTGSLYRSLFDDESSVRKYHPFCIYIVGEPGVGKTKFSGDLAQYIRERLAEDGYGQIPDDMLMYSRNQSDKYWSKYNGQLITYIDDIFQNRESTDPEDFMGLIGDSAMPMNMASVADKGKMFCSRLVICSSNSPFPEPSKITTPAAIWRRRNILLDLSINSKYAPRSYAENGDREDFWHFQEKDPLNKSALGTTQYSTCGRTAYMERLYQKFLLHHSQKYPNDEFPLVRQESTDFFSTIEGLIMPVSVARELVSADYFTMPEGDWVALPGAKIPDKLLVAEEERKIVIHRVADTGIKTVNEWISSAGKSFSLEKFFTSVKDKIPESVRNTITPERMSAEDAIVWHTMATKALFTLGIGSVCGIVYYLYKKFISCSVEEQSAVGKLTKNAPRTRLVPPKMQVPKPLAKMTVVSEQAGSLDQNAADVISRVSKNLVYLQKEKADKPAAFGLVVSTNMMIMNRHVYEAYKCERVKITKVLDPKAYWIVTFKNDVVTFENSDVMLMKTDGMPMFPSITKHLLSKNDDIAFLGNDYEVQGILLTANNNTIMLEEGRLNFVSDYKINIVDNGEPRNYWFAQKKTLAGECGVPVLCYTASKQLKVCGIHHLGDINQALSLKDPVFAEMVEATEFIENADFESIKEGECSVNLPRSLSYLGKVEVPHHFPTKTKFAKSPVCGALIEPKRVPSILTMKDSQIRGTGEDPYEKALKKYVAFDEIPFSTHKAYVDQAIVEVAEFFKTFPKYLEYRKIYDVNMALNGTVLQYQNHLDLNTSIGYPFKIGIKHKGKKDYLEIDEETDSIVFTEKGKILEDRLLARIEAAKEGKRIESFWYDNLKDELLPPEKIEESKTRIFVSAPVDHLLALRMYTLGFVGHSMYNCIQNGCGPGLRESLSTWHYMATQLSRFNKFLCGDFSNWDKTLKGEILEASCEVINRWYNDCPENQRVRNVLFDEMIRTAVIAKDDVYGTAQGNKSGAGLTTPINNIVQLVLLRAIYLELCDQTGNYKLKSWREYRKNVLPFVYGDDHVIGVSDEICEWFNQETLQQMFASYGITYTDPHKKGFQNKYEKFEDVTFIKRKFVKMDQFWIGQKDLDDVLDILSYVRTGQPMQTVFEQTVSSFLRELWKHGESTYNMYTQKLREAIDIAVDEGRLEKPLPPLPTWEYLHSMWIATMTSFGEGSGSCDSESQKMGEPLPSLF